MTTFIDNVAGLVTAPGTADFTSFSAVGTADAWSTVSNGTAVAYRAAMLDGSAGYETGEGVYTAGTLTRVTIKTSTAGAGVKHDFSAGSVLVSLVADSSMLSQWLDPADNLSDLSDAATARTNLGVDAAGTDNSTNVTLTGEDFLSLSVQEITANPIDLDNLSATGTPDGTTFLRGDNTWATPAGGGGDLDGLSDVTITAPADNEVLAYDGVSDFINQTPSEAGLQAELSEGAFVDGDKTKLDGIEALADVTNTANVTSAGALMDSEVSSLSGVKTLTVPDSTTISAFGATLIDDATAVIARTTLDVDQAGTDNSTNVTLAGEDYLSLSSQEITALAIDLDNLSATGTPSSSTFLRGDNTWAAPAGGGGGGGMGAWKFDSTITLGTSAGFFRADSATPASITGLWINEENADGVDLTNFLSRLAIDDFIYIQQEDDSTKAQLFQVTAISDLGTEWDITVTHIDGGTGGLWGTPNKRCAVVVFRGTTLDSLSDVTITTPADNELLAYNTGTSEWINQTPAEAGLQAELTEGPFVDGDKTKLDGIATGANNYSHPNHTGDVTSTGDGATVIANDVVTNAKLANVATDTIKGRTTAATGDPEDLTPAQVRNMINVEDGSTADQSDAEIKTAYENNANTNAFTDAEQTKLAGVESGATGDQTAGEIKTAYESNADTNVFTDAEQTKVGHLSVTQAVDLDQMETDIAALANGMVYQGNWDASVGTFPGGGTAQTGAFYYVNVGGTVGGTVFDIGDNIVAITDNASTTVYAGNWSKHDQTDAVQSVAGLVGTITDVGLRGAINVEDGSTADQTGAEIKIAYEAEADTNAFTDADHTKLDGIETAADVTDTANVTAAGALMDSEVSSLSGIKTLTVPDSTTISTFGATLVDDLDALTARGTLGVDPAGTINYTHPNHTGDVTSTGDGATVIANDTVSNAKLADVATDTIKGRTTAATGDPEDLTPTQVRDMINVADGANNYSHPNHTGDVTSTGDGATVIANNAVTNAQLADVATDTIKGRTTAATGDPEDLTPTQARSVLNVADGANNYSHPNHTGDVTSTGDGATVIANDVVSNAKLANMAGDTIKGRRTSTGDPEDLTPAQVKTTLGYMTDVVDDATPQLGGDLGAQENDITGIGRLEVTSTVADFTADPGAFIDISTDHTYDWAGVGGRSMNASVSFAGTHTIKGGNASAFGLGALFNATGTIVSEPGEANNLSPYYTLNASCTFDAVNETITQSSQVDFFAQTKFNATGTGSLTVTSYNQFNATGSVGAGATVTSRRAFVAGVFTDTGTLTNDVGFASDVQSGTNNTDYLIGYGGGDTPPTGDWSVYQGNSQERARKWNGGVQQKVTTYSGTSTTLNKTHHIVNCTSTAAVTLALPPASDGEQEYYIKKSGNSANAISLNLDGSDTADGSLTNPSINAHNEVLHVISDGSSDWLILHSGAP